VKALSGAGLTNWPRSVTGSPEGQGPNPEQRRIQELEARCKRLEQEKDILKRHRSLDVGRHESYALIDQLSERMPVEMVCNAFDVSRSSYYEYRHRRNHVDMERMALRAQVNRLFTKSRSSAGSRTIKGLLSEEGVVVGRFKGSTTDE